MSEELEMDSAQESSNLQRKSKRSHSPVLSSVSMASDHSKGDGPNLSEKQPSPIRSERSHSPVLSSVSMASDHSKGDGPNLSEKQPSPIRSERSRSPVHSSASMASDHSKGDGPNLSEKKTSTPKSVKSGSYMSISVKSDQSKGDVPWLIKGTTWNKRERSGSRIPCSVSVKSDHSKGDGPNLSEKVPSPSKSVTAGSRVSSIVSMKSDHSKGDGPNLSEETSSTVKSNKERMTTVNIGAEAKRWEKLKAQKGMKSDEELAAFLLNKVQSEKSDADLKNLRYRKDFRENLHRIFMNVENKIIAFLRNELEKFKKIIQKSNTQYFVQEFTEDMVKIKEAILDITLYFLRDMKENNAADTLQDELVLIFQRKLKSNLKKKHQSVSEGIAKQGDSKLLNNIYTDLYMTQCANKQVNIEHEVRQIQAAARRQEAQEIQIECKDLFDAPDQDKQIRTVLTKGVAGIGKSVSVQKFIIDWAEGKENQDITFIFLLAFREMNMKEKDKQNLMSLICQFFPEIKGLNLTRSDKYKILFILDGLDECRLPLNFDSNETWCDVSSPASLDVLLTNLIKGNLLPSALVWITTRPAAAIRIPPEFVDRVTEIQGFNDGHKKENYFRKRFRDEGLAKEIIAHVKQSKSLFIMCYIPVFCWISATVLENILQDQRNNDMKNNQADDASKTLQESNTEDTPKTLTQMYTHFLRFQILQSRRKYEGKYTPDVSWDKDAMFSLGKLAFDNLAKNNLIFYDTDLEKSGIDVSEASVFSGMCTQIFKEKTGIILGTTFCFVHLSIQEFIAALYAHLFLDKDKKNVFRIESTELENRAMIDLLKTAVDKALESDNGHLDLFLRFLLGLSLNYNRPLFQGLLTQKNTDQSKEIVQYIKQKLEDHLSPERSINLFYCLNELNDQTLVKEIQNQLSSGSLSSADLSPAQWSAVAFVLLTSDEEMEEFELQKFKKSDECLFRLMEVVKNSKRALLNECELTKESCGSMSNAFSSENNLIELNMSNNDLQDSGVQQLCSGLESTMCKLEILGLSKCSITEESCSALASALSSDSSSLKDLDLSNNNLKGSGLKLLSDKLKDNCKLEKLRLSDCHITEEGYKALASALKSKLSHITELDLRGNDPGESGVKELLDVRQDLNPNLQLRFLGPDAEKAFNFLTDVLNKNPLLLRKLNLSEHKIDRKLKELAPLLADKHCKINTLILNGVSIGEAGCATLASAFNSNPTKLKELDLSRNQLRDSGVTQISALLKNSQCSLQILRMSDCSIGEEGYKALASALRSNPSHLKELDLRGNDPGQSGVKELTDVLQDPLCKANLRFLSRDANKVCQFVKGIVGKNPLLLKELNLSDRQLRDTTVKELSVLLQDKHCKISALTLNISNITEEDCAALSSAFNLNPSNLKELNLSQNKLGNSGISKICLLLKNKQCGLEILRLSHSSISEEGYKALASALRSNPSHLIELDLRGNDPGQSGVKELTDLSQYICKTLTIRFLSSSGAEEACDHLTKVLGISPLLLTELDLNEDKLKDLDGGKLSALLMDSHSKVEKIKLNNCELTEKSLSVLATVLSSKTILKELNLNNSRLLDSGVRKICERLKNPVCQLKILKLNKCNLTEESCSALASVLSSDFCSLKALDLSNNNLQDSGVKLLSDGLKDSKLEKLSLSDCSISEEGYKALASALRSNPSHLIELDLRGNDPGQSGVKELLDVQQDKLTIKFLSPDADAVCQFVTRIVGKNPLLQKELKLSELTLDFNKVNQLAALVLDKHCKLSSIQLNNNSITEEGCAALTSAFNSNPSHLIELDLSGNKLGDSGMKNICCLLQNVQCRLEKVKLSRCNITAEGYKALASALKSNPSHQIKLDLTGNYPGPSGLSWFYKFFVGDMGILKNISFLSSPDAVEAYDYLTDALGTNPLLLTELDLSKVAKDYNWEKLSAFLLDSCCIVEKIRLNNCEVTNKMCSVLATVLSKNKLLKEMDLNRSPLLDSGVKKICDGLKKSTLKILNLSDCSISGEGYKALASALRSNPSHLIELDLRGNDPGQSGVKELTELAQYRRKTLSIRFFQGPAEETYQYLIRVFKQNPLISKELNLNATKLDLEKVNQLTALLQDKHFRINRLQLSKCGLTKESCSVLASVLSSDSSSLKELDLSNNNLQDSGVKQLWNGLMNNNCTLEKLNLSDCSISEEGYKALASALRSNPSHLIELDLRGNYPGQSGVKELTELLQDRYNKLKTLRFLSPDAENACKYVPGLVGKDPFLVRELSLRDQKLGDTNIKYLAALLQDKHCKLNTIQLLNCGITEEQCVFLSSALKSNPSHLRELNLSGNKIRNTGVNLLCDVLEDSHCKLERLSLCSCSLTDDGCSAVTSALKSNPSHLRELNLSGNQIKNTGVNLLCELLKDSHCKLETLRLRCCSLTDEDYKDLASALKENPLHLRELDLSENKLGDSGMEKLSDLLKNLQHKLEKLHLYNCSITEKQCKSLTSALKLNPSHLRELDLSGNEIKNKGVNLLCDVLKDSHCKLETLSLHDCGITDVSSLTQCLMNTKALQFLKELDLSKNKLGDSKKELSEMIKVSDCKLRLGNEEASKHTGLWNWLTSRF